MGQLAKLGTHRGSAEVLCAAYCTRDAPEVWWDEMDIERAREREAYFKRNRYGEPPYPENYGMSCKHGKTLREQLVKAAGANSWEAGCIETVFAVGEMLNILFDKKTFEDKFGRSYSRMERIWGLVGKPSGPWSNGRLR